MDFKVDKILSQYGIDGTTDPQSLNRIQQIGDERLRAEAVADQLESVFFGMVIKAMRATVPESDSSGRGLGRSQYVQMLDQRYAEIAGMPRDPRFHEALVRQILADPGATERVLDQMREAGKPPALNQTAALRQVEAIPTGEAQAS
jgi:Rod binding domain-containing protein